MENKQNNNNNNVQNEVKELDQIVARKNKLEKYRELGIDPFGQKFNVTNHVDEIVRDYQYLKEEEICEEKEVSLAGRIHLLRKMGKASFFNIKDKTGSIQCYIKKDVVGDDNYNLFKMSDLGDIVGVCGHVMKTMTGTLTIRVSKYTHLTKALRPLPEKFKGLTDIETRSRKRYLDLIVNEESMKQAFARPKIIRGLQRFLDSRGYVEVETPVLSPILGGASARPFITHHNTLNSDFYLRIATELSLKRLLVGGMERVYEIGRLFRNEGMDQTHNPEFTTCELYQAYGDLFDMMDIMENLLRELAMDVRGTYKIEWNGNLIDVEPKFRRASMVELIKEKTGVDFLKVKTDEEARKLCQDRNIKIENHFTFGHCVNAFFEEYVEKDLIQPTFVTGHPIEISPLTKKDPKDPRFTQRFELFIGTKEFSNAYTELNDPIDQKERFLNQLKERNQGNEEANDMDEDFVEALEYGLPPTGGMGIGIDRLVMFLTSTSSIREVILFPTMKPLNNNIKKTNNQNAVETSKIDFSNIEVEPLYKDLVDFDTFVKCDLRVVKVLACEAVKKSKKLLKFTLDDGSGTKRNILSGIHAYYEPEELVGKTCVAITNLPPRAMMGHESNGMLISAVCKQNGEEKLSLLILDDLIPAGSKLC